MFTPETCSPEADEGKLYGRRSEINAAMCPRVPRACDAGRAKNLKIIECSWGDRLLCIDPRTYLRVFHYCYWLCVSHCAEHQS